MKTSVVMIICSICCMAILSCQKSDNPTNGKAEDKISEKASVSASFFYDENGDIAIRFNSVSGLDLDATFEMTCTAMSDVTYFDGEYAYPAVYHAITDTLTAEAKPYFGSARTDRHHVVAGESVKLFPIKEAIDKVWNVEYKSYLVTESNIWHESYATIMPSFINLTVKGKIHFFKTKEQLVNDIMSGQVSSATEEQYVDLILDGEKSIEAINRVVIFYVNDWSAIYKKK